ncbi:PREDICTED: MOXD1 homolog 1 [Ceratosolen solmsi marchali]|uniref:MOXD1 homolog 1 n=1 Tax=Ceratosolen solmsi marchali TaxID=326594 RepID=A0AAJ7DUU8_9HYME|nr:PREDICTED: MOXD1 homolog 1 [Ceratosolen solmsi marchali]
MLCLRALAFVCTFLVVGTDLLDFYVHYMNETMRTQVYSRHRALKLQFWSRYRRSILESSIFRVTNPVKQMLDINDKVRDKKKLYLKKNSLDSPNLHTANSDIDNYISLKAKKQNEFHYSMSSKTEIEQIKDDSALNSIVLKNIFKREPKKFKLKHEKDSFIINKRSKRNEPKMAKFTRYERLDEEGDVVLEWDPSNDENVTFRLTGKTLGYIGLGFNDKGYMMGADIILAWVDDHTHVTTLLDSHGIKSMNAAPETDASQDVHLINGFQNNTHTIVTFTRRWYACDTQDRSLTGDTIRVLWALHQTDPELNTARFHGNKRGVRALRLRAPAPHPPPTIDDNNLIKWDVKLNQFTISNTSDTIYWCKIFKAPKLQQKHHMIGYTPLVEKFNEALVHHVILYECASTQPILSEHARLAGAYCYSPTMPKEWDSCMQPVLAWTHGSQGEWYPEHVGFPIAEHVKGSYYMLEVHYNNKISKQTIDSSGVRLYLTSNLRKMEAGILVAGIAVSPLHMVPPQQKEYATAGYCTPQCTNKMFDTDGINIVSVVLHSHLAGRRLSLKHIRHNKELPPIIQDKHFNFDYQQSFTLEQEAKIMPGDELVVECVYNTLDRNRPTFGGYAAYQEMCLAFIVHYPRTLLAACYSMTPVKEFFNALNIQSFKDISMEQVEKLFLSTTTETAALPISPNQYSPIYHNIRTPEHVNVDIIKQAKSTLISKGDYIDYDDIFTTLIIDKPDEFKGHTLSDHMSALAWNDIALSKSIEKNLYHGKYVTFCRTKENKLPQVDDYDNDIKTN